jgi:hypothetical protein
MMVLLEFAAAKMPPNDEVDMRSSDGGDKLDNA